MVQMEVMAYLGVFDHAEIQFVACQTGMKVCLNGPSHALHDDQIHIFTCSR